MLSIDSGVIICFFIREIEVLSKSQPYISRDCLRTSGRLLVACVLFSAIYLKLAYPTEMAIAIAGYGIPSWVILASSHIELILGICLAFNAIPVITHTIGLGVFTLFGFYSLYRGLSGAESCGCFGALTVSPWITLLIDLFACTILIAIWPKRNVQMKWSWGLVIPVYFVLSIQLWNSDQNLNTAELIIPVERNGISLLQELVILEPEEWIGEEFPITSILQSETDLEVLSSGEWTILFYHHDCPKCSDALTTYQTINKEKANMLLIEVPPFDKNVIPINDKYYMAHLPPNWEWFVETPIRLKLQKGKVVSASKDFPSSSQTQIITN